MKNKFKTPKISNQNIISFTCSDSAVMSILLILQELKSLGDVGASRNVTVNWGEKNTSIFFDGDGADKVNNIIINGMSLQDWKKEWKRLDEMKSILNKIDNEPTQCG